MQLKQHVGHYWERHPCGTGIEIVGQTVPESKAWFEQIEEHRYRTEPFIHSVAQFTRYHGKRVLEVGVGAGTDFLQWARAGSACVGIDLTEAAVRLTRRRLCLYGFSAPLLRADVEGLPFADETFDLVYSWGVLHHSEDPQRAVNEIWRILKPNGVFRGMMYHRRSLVALKLWLRHALLAGRPWRGLADVIANHMESPGTKAYTLGELRSMFGNFRSCRLWPILTPHDIRPFPRWLAGWLPSGWGWFVAITAER